jgi:hypothetical protein
MTHSEGVQADLLSIRMRPIYENWPCREIN